MQAVKLTDEQFNVLSKYLSTLIEQHVSLTQQIQSMLFAMTIFSFIGVVFIGLMLFAAAWSVRKVITYISPFVLRQADLEAKFTLLIDILLEDAKRKRNSGQSESV